MGLPRRSRLRRSLHLRRALRGRLALRRWRLHRGLAGLVFAAAPAAPVPLRLHLTVVRRRPLFKLGRGRFCCHDACTSWCFALVRCFWRAARGHRIALPLSAFPPPRREFAAVPRQRAAFFECGVAPRIDVCRHFRPSHFAAGRRLQCACFHHSTLSGKCACRLMRGSRSSTSSARRYRLGSAAAFLR